MSDLGLPIWPILLFPNDIWWGRDMLNMPLIKQTGQGCNRLQIFKTTDNGWQVVWNHKNCYKKNLGKTLIILSADTKMAGLFKAWVR